MMNYYFKTEKMSVGYHKKPLIEAIDITLNKGEILTLIGPNGAGKSTILKSIAKQLQLIGGVVYLNGKNLEDLSGTELSKKMAVVLTERLRTELMTCEDVVATGRYPYTGRFGILSREDYQVVEEAMELVHVTDIRNQDFTRISDGQRQRVMLARAICEEPEIILLDEPTSYLDIRYKLEFLSVLQEMRRKKKLTVIMSLHELDLAERISDKILCINGKYVERIGRPEEIFKQGYIEKLFSISEGSYDEESGSMELPAAAGKAGVFVIAGGGTGRRVYRSLQRQGIAFATGILFENDLDYPVAKALAAEVVTAKSFEPVSEELVTTAEKLIVHCEKVICCKEAFGTFDASNGRLLEYARRHGKQIEFLDEKQEGKA